MNRDIEKYLVSANKILENGEFAEKDSNPDKITDKSEIVFAYKSAIKSNLSAIPVNIRFYGLIPTIAMFGGEDTSPNKDKKYRNNAMCLVSKVLKDAQYLKINNLKQLLEYNRAEYSSETELRQLALEVQHAATALKFVIRTFNILK